LSPHQSKKKFNNLAIEKLITMKSIKILLLVVFVSFSSFANAESCDSLTSVEWLIGQWLSDDGNNITLESWQQVSSSTFEGRGETRSKTTNELKSSETLRLVEMANEVFFVAKVSHNEKPVAFKLTECSCTHAVFENPKHDFPKKLEYTLDNDNELTVIVSDGQDKGFKINFIKQDKHIMKITGKFEVNLNPMEAYATGENGINIARMSLDKTFQGDLDAVSKGEMLSAMTATKGSAGYVAIEQVTGTLSGKSGSFVLQHFGTMSKGKNHLILEVVPDSGSDELSGLSGTMNIRIEEGQHYYDFEYTLK